VGGHPGPTSRHRLEEEVDRRLLVEGVQAVVTQVEEALHLLHAREERLVRPSRGERFRMIRHRRAVAAHRADHVQRQERDVAQRLEADRVAARRLQRGDLGPLPDRQLALRAFAGRELQHHPGRLGRLEAHADQVEEGEEVLLRHLVEPVDDHLGHPHKLEQGDSGSDVLWLVHSG
jgi:hypothetical protein